MNNVDNFRFFMDETSSPYKENENPFPRTKEDDAFDEISHSDLLKVAYHEAGHVLVHEILDPESVALVSMFGSNYDAFGGRTVFNSSSCILSVIFLTTII